MTPAEPDAARGGRRRAREVAFRALFEADLSGDDPLEVLELSLGRFRFTADGRRFALRLAEAYGERRQEIDRLLAPLLDRWTLARLSTVVRAILRLAVTELVVIEETPPRVILNEAIRLADRYGEPDAGPFVNGVLDAATRRLRPGALGED
ncbi:MAG: transcription antitermination factor NusB [Candidatus Eisenbacteria bacterium]|nr:transcription antitermination factor NusB [Candidatus Latescibacterota bacterium]MBD3302296.1 transcription antitermination factor NusB [Candidatus Eisenbacteria bacterium]